jgi:DNA-binding IclR family transcriptional regulator
VKQIEKKQQDSINTEDMPDKGVQSIIRAAAILRCLGSGINSIKDIGENCGLSASTVHRILQTLVETGLAFQDPGDHKYYLGILWARISMEQSNAHKYLLANSVEEVNRIWDFTGECTALGVGVGMQVVTLLQLPCKFSFGVIERSIRPLFLGSENKALMSLHNDDEINILLANARFQPDARNEIIDKEKLKEQFGEVRLKGYAISRNELSDDGIMGISVPINNYSYPAALTVVGPESRMLNNTDKIVNELLTSGKRISKRIARKNADF